MTKLPALTIYYKIVIPFTLVFVVVTVITAFVSMSLISQTLEDKITSQIDHASEMLSKTGFALNASILEKVKLIVGADIVTYRRDGEVIASTLTAPTDQDLLRLTQSPDVIERLFMQGKRLVIRDIRSLGLPYKVAYRPLRRPPDTLVAFVVATSDIAQAQRNIAIIIGTIAILMVVSMFLISRIIATSITSPVQRLVEYTETLAAGDLTQQAEVRSRDEIGRLATAFNNMIHQLRRSEAKLIQSEKLALVGQLAAGVAHDVRNPLSSLKMHVQLLRTKLKGDQDSLRVMLREIDRVEWVVKGLLDLGRPDVLQRAPGSVNDVLLDTLALTGSQLAHRKIAINTQLDNAIPLVMIDADRLKQAVLNLILNATDAMPDGGTLLVSTAVTNNGAAVNLEICDDGIGIDAEIRDKLFDPFFTTKREGVGLGLVNTKSVVERHGGTIRLIARDGKGTCAVVTLPVRGKDYRIAGGAEDAKKS